MAEDEKPPLPSDPGKPVTTSIEPIDVIALVGVVTPPEPGDPGKLVTRTADPPPPTDPGKPETRDD
jgi:hypothetical protein